MQPHQVKIAQASLQGAHDGTLSFPEICEKLIAAGFEGYMVDYRRGTTSYYLPDDEGITLESQTTPSPIAASFDQAAVAAQVRWAQSQAKDYSYEAFSKNLRLAGCAGYMVSFLGRRVVYFGRGAETHVELFPPAS